jgi:4-hydroxybenzoyl-CoA thioesterase
VEEFFSKQLGIDFADVLHERNVSLPTVHVESDFRKRLKYGDRIDIEVRILHIGRTSITWCYWGYRGPSGEELVVEGQNITVCVRADTLEKIEVPEWLRSALTNYERGITGSL